MGGQQAASVLATVRRDQLEARGERGPRGRGGVPGAAPRAVRGRRAAPTTSTARLWDDGIIDPADTRRVLGLALDVVSRAPLLEPGFGLFRM